MELDFNKGLIYWPILCGFLQSNALCHVYIMFNHTLKSSETEK